jgi:hypothetical protein
MKSFGKSNLSEWMYKVPESWFERVRPYSVNNLTFLLWWLFAPLSWGDGQKQEFTVMPLFGRKRHTWTVGYTLYRRQASERRTHPGSGAHFFYIFYYLVPLKL